MCPRMGAAAMVLEWVGHKKISCNIGNWIEKYFKKKTTDKL